VSCRSNRSLWITPLRRYPHLRSGRGRAIVAVVVALIAAAVATPGTARAHPLGNFTVNRYAGIELSGGRVYVHYALDLAEIPSFQEGDAVKAPGYARRVAERLVLRLDGRRVPLVPLDRRVVARPGAGGLTTLRFDAVFVGSGRGARLDFRDTNFAQRIGWREVTLTARDGARVATSSVPAESASNALRSYPNDLLRAPLGVSTATARVTLGSGVGVPPRIGSAPATQHRGGGFEALIERGELSLGVVLVSLLIAAFWGAAHALTPGHGKALVAGYLIGTRGRPRDAVLLGATVTVTHTAGVFALGLVTLLLSRFIVPERLYPWLTLVSGLLVISVGASILVQRLRARRRHAHAHRHHHDHHHQHHDVSSRGVLGVGIAAGLLPCPSALVVLLSAIALHRIGFGFALIAAFSLGLAATITGIGLVAVLARRAFGRLSLDGPLVRALPAVSAAVIVVVGLAIAARAVPALV
jgi:nickel/cobalt transporter (NicO) family protein